MLTRSKGQYNTQHRLDVYIGDCKEDVTAIYFLFLLQNLLKFQYKVRIFGVKVFFQESSTIEHYFGLCLLIKILRFFILFLCDFIDQKRIFG